MKSAEDLKTPGLSPAEVHQDDAFSTSQTKIGLSISFRFDGPQGIP